MSPSRYRPLVTMLALAILAFVLVACGAPSAPGDPGGGPQPSDPVAATLDTLGVDTTATQRRAPDGSTLGGGDAPLGVSASLGDPTPFTNESGAHPHMELVLATTGFAGSSLDVRKIENVAVTPTGTIEYGSESILASA